MNGAGMYAQLAENLKNAVLIERGLILYGISRVKVKSNLRTLLSSMRIYGPDSGGFPFKSLRGNKAVQKTSEYLCSSTELCSACGAQRAPQADRTKCNDCGGNA
jgi:hypothetical protein